MDIKGLVRDKGRLGKALKTLPDGSMVALEPLVVHIPVRFVEKGLAEVTDVVETICVIGLIVDNYYSCLFAHCTVRLIPNAVKEISIDGEKYLSLEFAKGDTVIVNLTTPIDSKINYLFYMEFGTYGKLPWYMNQENLNQLFDHTQYITEHTVGSGPQVFRLLVGLMLRDPDNLESPYRYSEAIKKGIPPAIVGLNNHSMLITGTFNRLNGGYLADNTISAILNQETKLTDIDMVMRGIPYKDKPKEVANERD